MDIKINKDELVEFYTNPNDLNEFDLGFIISKDENFYIVRNVSKKGKFNGYSCIRINSIQLISIKTIYIRKILKLMEQNNQENLNEFGLVDFESCMKLLLNKRMACTIEMYFNDIFITGFISKFEKDLLYIEELDRLGNSDGLTIIFFEDVKIICFYDDNSKKIESLNQST